MADMSDAALPALASRLDDLESRIAYQDDVIERLNKVVVEQWGRLDQALQRIARLEAQLREVQNSIPTDGQDEPPPPHY